MAFTKITAAGIGTTETVTVDGLTVINNGSFGGNLTVAGVLTYEDVTNVDSVGLITARNGIVVGSGITLSKDGDIFATGITTVSGNVKVGTGITLSPDGDIFSTGITTIRYTGTAQYGLDVHNPTSGGSGIRVRAGDSDSQYALLVENGLGNNLFEILAGGGGARLRSGDLAILDKIAHYGDGNTFIRFPAADTVTVETGGSEAIRVDSSQNFGVGTNSPTARLDVRRGDADGKIAEFHTSTGFGIDIGSSQTLAYISSGNAQNWAFKTDPGSGQIERLRIESDGDFRLSSGDAGTNYGYIRGWQSSTGDMIIGADQSATGTNGSNLIFRTRGGEKVRIEKHGTLKVSNNLSVTGITTSQAFLPSEGQLSHRNLVVNGAMRVAQRGTTYTGGYGTANNGLYYKTVDRMFVYAANLPNTDVTTAQIALTSGSPYDLGFRYAFRIQMGYQGSVPSNVKVGYQHRMEAQDIVCSGWKHTSSSSYLTLSFWVKSNVAQTFYGQLRTIDGTSYHYPFSYALSANTWTKVVKTIPGNSNLTINNDTGEGLRIDLSPYYGTDETNNSVTLNAWGTHSNSAKTPDQTSTWYSTNGATFEVTGLQLEVGQVATPFEHRKFSEELALCKRYYQEISQESSSTSIITGFGNGTNRIRAVIPLMVEMRSNPVVTLDTSAGNPTFYSYTAGPPSYSSLSGVESTTKTITVDIDTSTVTAGAPYDWRGSSAFITIDAEY